MVHLLAINMQVDTYLNMINANQNSKEFDITDEFSSQSSESEKDFSNKQLDDFIQYNYQFNKKIQNYSFETKQRHNFYFHETALPIVHFGIQSPPPRA